MISKGFIIIILILFIFLVLYVVYKPVLKLLHGGSLTWQHIYNEFTKHVEEILHDNERRNIYEEWLSNQSFAQVDTYRFDLFEALIHRALHPALERLTMEVQTFSSPLMQELKNILSTANFCTSPKSLKFDKLYNDITSNLKTDSLSDVIAEESIQWMKLNNECSTVIAEHEDEDV